MLADVLFYQIPQPAPAMNVAHDFRAIVECAVQNQIVPDGEMPDTFANVRPGHAKVGIVGERVALFLEKVDEMIRSSRAGASDVGADVDQIATGLRRNDQA